MPLPPSRIEPVKNFVVLFARSREPFQRWSVFLNSAQGGRSRVNLTALTHFQLISLPKPISSCGDGLGMVEAISYPRQQTKEAVMSRKRNKVQAVRAKVASRRTEILINLNMFTSPTDDEIPPFKTYNCVHPNSTDSEMCPPEYERRAAGIVKMMHLCAPSSLLGRRVPSCCVRVEPEGILVIHMRAIWGNRKSVLIGMATQNEMVTADHLKCAPALLVNEDRLLLNLANGVDIPGLAEDEYWGSTAWHAIHYIR